ncbi:hypothetical protein DFQ04_0952 [Algoriphagus boseongensis]|uniref:Uncharacterized protein n=1 Tax=Algoriphagus boseongensis TaxID=1442587 RepID=A0A4R6TBS8_9BACT|nr:hypothetical protein DFQ04_0952 [Algoriphagus boseongensis]
MNTSALIIAILTQGSILAITAYCFYLILKKPSSDQN